MISYLYKKRPAYWMMLGIFLVVIIGAADFFTESKLSLFLFYLAPIIMVTWFLGRNFGLVVSLLCVITWLAVNVLEGQTQSHSVLTYLNSFIRFIFFAAVAWHTPALKAFEHEKEIGRFDYLTGAANRRYLTEALKKEIDRYQRYKRPFALAYIDLDGLKSANDQLGHKAGDAILCAVVAQTKKLLRKTDMMARIGGDEFVLFFPETDQESLRKLMSRIHSALIHEMYRSRWPVTFSIGALTCRNTSKTAEELIGHADALMYTVKKSGKNAVAYAECET